MHKLVDKLSTSLVQVFNLYAISTGRLVLRFLVVSLYMLNSTAFTTKLSLFAQPIYGRFKLLGLKFYTLSTGPITNTKLIKDLY